MRPAQPTLMPRSAKRCPSVAELSGACATADVQPVCSPTRATILTGRHVIHTGVYDPMNGGSGDLSLNFTLLPQHLATMGYTCHMVGKVRFSCTVSVLRSLRELSV